MSNTLRPNSAPQREASVLAVIYARAIQRYEETKAAHPGGPDDAERRSNEIRAKDIIPR